MIISSESLKKDIDQLSNDQLKQVAEFIAFLKFRDKRRGIVLDPALLAPLATEVAEDERDLAEMGIEDYRDFTLFCFRFATCLELIAVKFLLFVP
jgi:hypothetical protein